MEVKSQKHVAEARGIPRDLPINIPITEVRKGFQVWTNPDNKFTVIQLHYSADPKKDNDEWRARTRAGYTWQEWLQEYEIVDSAFDGMPVYGEDFSYDFHVSPAPLVWNPEFPVVRGWDVGLAAEGMAVIFAQLLPPNRLLVYRELTASDMDLEHFVPEVRRMSFEWFPNARGWYDVVDPSGNNRNQLDKRKATDLIRQGMHTKPIPGVVGIIDRRRAVSRFLKENRRGTAAMLIDASCRLLIEGFVGGYHYSFSKFGQLKPEPEKNEYSHIHDALQYLCTRVAGLDFNNQAPRVAIPSPQYNFRAGGVIKGASIPVAKKAVSHGW